MTLLKRKWLQVLILVAAAAVLILMPSPVPDNLLTNDFQAYWGASHLLSRSMNFTDPDLLLEVEQIATGYDQELPLITWNPPWFLAWFLPFGLTNFDRASWLWFLTNIALIFICGVFRVFPEYLFGIGVFLLVAGIIAGRITREE